MEHFWVFPLQRSHQQPNTATKHRVVVLSLLLQGRLVLRVPLAVQELERRGATGIHHCICASIAPTFWITSASFSYSVDHVTEVVWIILQGNGNYGGEQSQDHKSQSSWKSNRSACLPLFMPWASLLQPGIRARDWNPSRLEWLTHQHVEKLRLTSFPFIPMEDFGWEWSYFDLLNWGCAWGRPGCCSLVSFHQSLERTARTP